MAFQHRARIDGLRIFENHGLATSHRHTATTERYRTASCTCGWVLRNRSEVGRDSINCKQLGWVQRRKQFQCLFDNSMHITFGIGQIQGVSNEPELSPTLCI